MSDDDGDGVWTLTVPLEPGDHEYKYALGAWVAQETVPDECGTTGDNTNRAFTVAGIAVTTDPVPYSGCNDSQDVTFTVDMTGVDLLGQVPTVNGTFNTWCGNCNPMSDDDGDGVWTLTVPLEPGDHEYKYALGAWVAQEAVPVECGTTGENTNRAFTVLGTSAVITDAVAYSGCPPE